MEEFKYKDERDKSFGIAGMAISVVALDGEDYIDSISIDTPDGHSFTFSNDFFFINNPRFSAKIAWNEMLKQFQLTSAMLLTNLICRSYVQHRRKLSHETIESLREFVRSYGDEYFSLEKDEADNIFDKSLSYFDRIFSYSQVHEIASDFADTLIDQRQMSVREMASHLRSLSMI